MIYDQVYYSWLSDRDYKGNPYKGWGIAATSNNDQGFIAKALRQVSSVKAPEDFNGAADYYEYSENFGCFVRIGVRKLPPLTEMGGADNNRLVCLYVPVPDEAGKNTCGVVPYPIRYPEFVPQTVQTGFMPRLKTDVPVYDYQKILEKYGFSGKDGMQGLHSMAVLLAMRFLSLVSPEWKRIIITINRMPGAELYSTAAELTWMLEQLIPEKLFGKTKAEYLKETRYRAGTPENQYQGISYIAGNSDPGNFNDAFSKKRNALYQRHTFELFRSYDVKEVFSGNGLDRKTAGCSGLFESLAGKAQEGPDVFQSYLNDLCENGDVDSVYRLNMRYKSRFDSGFTGAGFFDITDNGITEDVFIREENAGYGSEYNSGEGKYPDNRHKSGLFDMLFDEDDSNDSLDSLFEDDLITEEDSAGYKGLFSKVSRKITGENASGEKGLLDLLFEDEDED